ncbi:MAG TPA: SDR family oxidoreductase [Blastocatellia bacterium]|nr:SDR family oxidoreductase [Blastocatellia bacterium]
MSDDTNMSGKVCVVTGANSGIGKVTALELARRGARVVMVCRDRARGEAALTEIKQATGNDQLELMLCDLSSQADIRRFADEFKATHDRLDVLVNNAGVYLRKRETTVAGIETTFAVNHLAYFLLTDLLLDLLKRSAPSRIVNVSSGAHTSGHINFDDLQGERAYGGVKAYCHSKLANILFTRELARRLAGTNVTANCLHPGAVATGIFRALPKPLEAIIKLLTMSPEKGAQTSVYLATSPAVEGVTGKYFVRCKEAQPSAEARDDAVAERLWAESVRLTSLKADAVNY